jgi:hypothetical protein
METVECAAVCAADSLSAARPGARREVLESFLKRVSEIEEIASSKTGVKQAYAINAGREVRVMVGQLLVCNLQTELIPCNEMRRCETTRTRLMTHVVRKFCAEHVRDICARFTPDVRNTRESDANSACTVRSSQKGMLLLDPSVYIYTSISLRLYFYSAGVNLSRFKVTRRVIAQH